LELPEAPRSGLDGGSEMDCCEDAGGKLAISGGDPAVVFETAEHTHRGISAFEERTHGSFSSGGRL